MFTLETERLLIRPWRDEDRPSFTALASDPEVVRYIHGGIPYAEPEIDEFLSRQQRQDRDYDLCMGAMVEKSSGRIVGIAGAQPYGPQHEIEIGWWLATEVWGRGYATEAGRAAMLHVLDVVKAPRVVAIIDPENEPSKRVAARLGMLYDARYSGAQIGYRKPEIVVDLFFRNRNQ